MLNWIPALFLLLMHGAATPESMVRDPRLPAGTVAFAQAAIHGKTQGPSLAAALRMIVRYATQAQEDDVLPAVVDTASAQPTRPEADQNLPEDVLLTSSRTRDGPSVV